MKRVEAPESLKKAARTKVNIEVKAGRLPAPNAVPCVDCGHIWNGHGNRHEYDHSAGYAEEHHLTVEVVCKACHVKRDNDKSKATICLNGHAYTPENTGRKANGTRFCRECRRIREKTKRTAEWWRARRERKAKNG